MNENDIYKLKYYKYKNKYIQLKQMNLEGGLKKAINYLFYINYDNYRGLDYEFKKKIISNTLRQYKGSKVIAESKSKKDLLQNYKEITLSYKDLFEISLLIIPYVLSDNKRIISKTIDWIVPSIKDSKIECYKLKSKQETDKMDIRDYFLFAKECVKLPEYKPEYTKIMWVDVKVYPVFPNEIIEFGDFDTETKNFLVYIDKEEIAKDKEERTKKYTLKKFSDHSLRIVVGDQKDNLSIRQIQNISLLVIPYYKSSILVSESPPSKWRFPKLDRQPSEKLKGKVVTKEMNVENYFELVKDCFDKSIPKTIFWALVSDDSYILNYGIF